MIQIHWTNIPDFDGYAISEDGKILSTKRKKQIIITDRIKNDKIYVRLRQYNKDVTIQVHILVARTFLDNPLNHKYIKFKDGNTLNINRYNLEWTSDPYSSNVNWEPLKGHQRYEISLLGIRNAKTKKQLTPSCVEGDYPRVGLLKDDGKIEKFRICYL